MGRDGLAARHTSVGSDRPGWPALTALGRPYGTRSSTATAWWPVPRLGRWRNVLIGLRTLATDGERRIPGPSTSSTRTAVADPRQGRPTPGRAPVPLHRLPVDPRRRRPAGPGCLGPRADAGNGRRQPRPRYRSGELTLGRQGVRRRPAGARSAPRRAGARRARPGRRRRHRHVRRRRQCAGRRAGAHRRRRARRAARRADPPRLAGVRARRRAHVVHRRRAVSRRGGRPGDRASRLRARAGRGRPAPTVRGRARSRRANRRCGGSAIRRSPRSCRGPATPATTIRRASTSTPLWPPARTPCTRSSAPSGSSMRCSSPRRRWRCPTRTGLWRCSPAGRACGTTSPDRRRPRAPGRSGPRPARRERRCLRGQGGLHQPGPDRPRRVGARAAGEVHVQP